MINKVCYCERLSANNGALIYTVLMSKSLEPIIILI